MLGDKYWPRQFEEMAEDPVPRTVLTEPLPPDNVISLVPRQRSIYAVLVENLNSTQALLTRFGGWRLCAKTGDCSALICRDQEPGAGASDDARTGRLGIVRGLATLNGK